MLPSGTHARLAWQSAAAAALTQSLSCSADLVAAVATMVLVGTLGALVGMTAGVSVCSVRIPVRLTRYS